MKLKYPLEVQNGRLVLTSDYPGRVRESILAAVLTEVEERVLRPDFGRSHLPFDTYQIPDILRNCRTAIQTALAVYPGIEFRLSGTPYDDGTLYILVAYFSPDLQPGTVEVQVKF